METYTKHSFDKHPICLSCIYCVLYVSPAVAVVCKVTEVDRFTLTASSFVTLLVLLMPTKVCPRGTGLKRLSKKKRPI